MNMRKNNKKTLLALIGMSFCLLSIPNIVVSGSWWDDTTYPYGYEIFSNATIAGMPISVNDTSGIGVDDTIMWTNNASTDRQWLVSTGVRVTGEFAIGSTTAEANWENETNMSGNNPTDVWDDNYMYVLHANNITVNDSTLNHSLLQIGSPTITPDGVFGNALSFNGSNNNYYNTTPLGIFNDDFTIEFWINQTTEEQAFIMSWDDENEMWFRYNYSEYPARTLVFGWYEGAVAHYLVPNDSLELNTLYYVVVKVNNSHNDMYYYLNGTLAAENYTFGVFDTKRRGSSIGSYRGGDFPMNGTLDEIRISNIGRSEEYIEANWNSGQDSLVTLDAEYIPPNIVKCNATSVESSADIYFRAENDSSFPLINSTAELYLSFTDSGISSTYNYSFTNDTLELCIYPAWSNLTVDGQLTYTNSSYTSRIYTFDNEIFDNDTTIFDMLLIDATDAPKVVKISVKDEYSNAYPDVVVKAQRWYTSLGTYKTAAAPLTDISGNAYTYLELDNAEYRFLLYKNGVLLKTIPKRIIPNVAADDPITIEFMVTFDQIIDWLIYKDKISGMCSYANSTGNLTCSYQDFSDIVRLSSVRLSVIKYTGALESTTLFSGTNTSVPSGTFVVWLDNTTVTTSSYSYTMTANLNINENEWFVIHTGILEEGEAVSKLFGDCKAAGNLIKCREGAIMTFFLTLTSALVGVSISPAVSILMMLAGMGISSAVGLWAISSQTMIGIVLVGAIMIYRMRGR